MTLATRLWNRLGTKLTVLFLALALLPLLAVGYLAYENGRQTIEQQQFSHLDVVNALKADELDRWVRDNVERLGSLAQRPLVQELAVALSDEPNYASAVDGLLTNHLRPALAEDGGYEELFLLRATDGLIVASTDEENAGKFRDSESYFLEGRRRPTVQNVYYDLTRGEPTMTVAAPLRDSTGETVAVLAGHVNLSELEEITDQTIELTETEDTYLVNGFNFFVTDPRFGEAYALRETAYTAGVERCLEGQSGQDFYADYRGEAVLGAYRWLPEREMCILTEIDQVEAFGPIVSLRHTLLSLGTMVALGIVAAGLFFTRSITRPLRQLTRGAKRIGQGELEHHIDVQSSDEIGQLAAAFNEMTSNLRQSVGETAHGRRLLLALSDAAQAVQLARSPQEVYETVGAEVDRLGFNATVLSLTADQKRARLAYLGYDSSLIRLGEKLAGVSAADYEFPLPSGGTYRRALEKGETLFIEQTREFIGEALPAAAQGVAGRLVTLLGMEQSIVAPLTVDGETLGLLTVSGDGLAEADVTAVKAFANQTAVALQNARLLEHLRQSEARFRAVFENAAMGITRVDLEGRLLDSNTAMQEMLGYDGEQLRQMAFADFTHPHDVQLDLNLYRSLVAGQRDSYQIEKRYIRSDGEVIWALLTVSLVRDADGAPHFAIGMAEDITERKRMEQERAEQQAFLESIYSGSGSAIFVVDVDDGEQFRYAGLNPAHEQLTGLKSAEVRGKTPHDLVPTIPPEAAAAIHANYARCVERGATISYEEMLPIDGQETWWLTRLSPQRDGQGRIYRIIGSSLSITERKRVEQELAQHRDHLEELVAERTSQLQQSEARFRALFEAAPMPLVVSRIADGAILEANQKVAQALGVPAGSLSGASAASFYQEPQARAAFIAQLKEHSAVRNHEVQIRRENGTTIWLLASAVPIDYEGEQALLAGFMDVTQRKEMEKALRFSEERFRALVQNANDIITIVNGDGAITYESPSLERVLGFHPRERLGQNILDVAGPEDRQAVTEAFAGLLEKPAHTVSMDVHVQNKEGAWRVFEVTAANLLENPAVQGIVINSHDITERVKAEKTLIRERDRFNRLLRTSPVGITFVDREGNITFANPQAEIVLGLSRETVTSRTYHAPAWRITDFAGGPFPEEELPFARARATGQTVYDVQHAIEKPSGERTLLSINATPVFDEDEAFNGIVATVQDITARKQAEEALRAYEAAQSALLNAILDSVFLMEPDGTLVVANETFADRFGRSREELFGANVYDLLPPEVATERRRYAKAVLRTGEPARFEDERYGRHIDNSIYPVFDDSGKVTHVAVYGRDITELKMVEAELQAIFKAMPDVVLVLSAEGEYLKVAASNPNLLYEKTGSLVGRNVSSIFPPEETALFLNYIQEALQTETTVQAEYPLTIDGKEVWFLASIAPLSKNAVVWVARDITHRKQAEKELQRSNEELQQFAYVASHDLQEPLRMVSSFLQLLQQRYQGQLDETADQYIYYAVDGAARMKRLINDLLQYSRVATRGQPIVPTNSQVILEQVLRDLSVTIEESGASISCDSLPMVMGDETQIRQLFQNLIGNAIKFRDDAPPQIHVSAARKNGMWQFAVSDNGIGIDPRFQERVFVIFQRLQRDEKYDGTGIGLAICRRIVRYHDGEIWVESEPGVGSTFHFTLPAVREERNELNGQTN